LACVLQYVVIAMADVIIKKRRDGIVQILPPWSRRGDPHFTSLLAMMLGTGLYLSTIIQWTAMMVIGVGCVFRELIHACREHMRRRNPPAPVQELPSRWRRAS
jgi:hypothetical protein